ncbi:uncharacterized protein LOC119615837 [Lucilia sericata]|uniref:uncharacterized protein LOC119615837 n=1 Tax=Lucilia sericata TaxID=13632 RepID=UPI0018A872B4|nr:uncharacterized protein LOC119615837 [Lucilia sericata]
MAFLKLVNISLVLILAQSVLCDHSDKILEHTIQNFASIPKHYEVIAANATQYLLKDKALLANHKPEVMEFKSKLNVFMDKYANSGKDISASYEALDEFVDLTDYYYELPEDKVNDEYKFIIELLNKYNFKDISMELTTRLEKFFETFVKMFDENRSNYEKSVLEHFDKFTSLTNLEEKIKFFIDFALAD